MRDGFRDIISGWAMDSLGLLTERIERAAGWVKENGPLEPDEEKTIKVLIEYQIAWGIVTGDFEPFIRGEKNNEDEGRS